MFQQNRYENLVLSCIFYRIFMDDWYIQVHEYHRSVSYCEHLMLNMGDRMFQQSRYENLVLINV